jgi:hypothetical protein
MVFLNVRVAVYSYILNCCYMYYNVMYRIAKVFLFNETNCRAAGNPTGGAPSGIILSAVHRC